MQKRKWDAKTKALIVLEGLKGKPVAEICHEHQISQSPYYQWRDPCLANAASAFESQQHTRKEERLKHENARLKQLVGELTLELKKKTTSCGHEAAPGAPHDPSDAALVPGIQALKAEHPFWGDRRLWAHLRFVPQCAVNKKRILRLMREQPLLVPPHLRLKAKRTPTRRKPQPTKPNAWWGIALTQVLVEGSGWVSRVVVLDWYTKQVVGH